MSGGGPAGEERRLVRRGAVGLAALHLLLAGAPRRVLLLPPWELQRQPGLPRGWWLLLFIPWRPHRLRHRLWCPWELPLWLPQLP